MEQQPTENTGAVETGTTSSTDQQQQPAAQPFKSFASQEELDKFMADRAKRAGRQALNAQARELGYDDWQEMQEALHGIRKTPAKVEGPDSPAKADPASNEANRLRMALTVAGELNLPAALIGRLQGATVDEMKADAQMLLGLFQQSPAAAQRPSIPPVPQSNQPVTFTQAQLQNPEFVRTHKDEILRAAREGRIARS